MAQLAPRRPIAGGLATATLLVGVLGGLAMPVGAQSDAPAANADAAIAAGPPFDLTSDERIAVGKKRFNGNCAAYCHGAEGSGGKTPPFKGNKDFTTANAFKTITEGRRATDSMPPWGNAFTPEQIWELVAYLQHLSTLPPAN
jgi:mono/diheme cytochrome c family protein